MKEIVLTLNVSELSIDSRKDIASRIKNPNYLDLLSRDEAWEVRYAVAKNNNINEITWRRLINDPVEYVATAAKNNEVYENKKQIVRAGIKL